MFHLVHAIHWCARNTTESLQFVKQDQLKRVHGALTSAVFTALGYACVEFSPSGATLLSPTIAAAARIGLEYKGCDEGIRLTSVEGGVMMHAYISTCFESIVIPMIFFYFAISRNHRDLQHGCDDTERLKPE